MAHRLLHRLRVLDMTETDQTTQPRRSGLTPGAPAPLYQQLSDLLRERIKSGIYGPLDRLPSEHELAREHSISRITARQALGELERNGLVFRLQGRGSFVARPTVVQGLAQLTGFAEAMSAQGLEAGSRVLRLGPTRAATDVAERLRVPPGTPLFEIRRVRLVNDSPVSFDHSYFPADLGRRLAREDLVRRDVFWLLENVCGVRLGAADHQIGAVAAEEDIALQLGVPAGAPLLLIDRLSYDVTGMPIDYEHLYVRSDRVRYGLRLERPR